MLFFFLFGCSDITLFSVDGDTPKAGPSDPDSCSFTVEDVGGASVLMKNEAHLSAAGPSGLAIEPGPNSEIARFIVEAVHPDCPALTISRASIMIIGGDEGAVGWPENLMAADGVTLQDDAGLSVGDIVDGALEVDHELYGDIFEWDGDVEMGVVIPGGESIEIVLAIDTTGAGTGEYPDPVKGRFGWLQVFDGSVTAFTVTNYYGPSVEIQ